ncbi:hypothetical protein IVB18_37780 [Bradyrhizobium sp. 186]|uniref:hypothetical protein n=1 Tax=Bradyrhizobium sp. 186 TaxID=2782654 RepID=UPI0020006FD4|nr:hypothetical protein [Bradyrhizobium sp. 186]UPK33881.1 hypothetical protein IVB18_37780 [Bradyrhizobium sp. 186]
MILLLIASLLIASGVVGFLLGRTFRAFVLIPATMLILVPAWYLGTEQGLVTGALSFVVSAVVMQVAYFASLLTNLLRQNLSLLDQVQSEASPPLPESRVAL